MKKAALFTLIELIMILSVICILAGLLIPVLSRAAKAADRSVCEDNLDQISIATVMYASDNNGAFIDRKVAYRILPSIYQYLTDYDTHYGKGFIDVFICPGASENDLHPLERRDWCTYGVNSRAPLTVQQVIKPVSTPAFGDQKGWYSGSMLNNTCVDRDDFRPGMFRHYNEYTSATNLIYFDGHVENVDEDSWRAGDLYKYLTWMGK